MSLRLLNTLLITTILLGGCTSSSGVQSYGADTNRVAGPQSQVPRPNLPDPAAAAATVAAAGNCVSDQIVNPGHPMERIEVHNACPFTINLEICVISAGRRQPNWITLVGSGYGTSYVVRPQPGEEGQVFYRYNWCPVVSDYQCQLFPPSC